ncbi:unannotated protein [freshwater metagenome]|uniref:Unannotated protein n=1 Tax=freshwater metagenome TaxID=449393 RepID=A0A6J7GIN1_9ZZZZ
MHHEVLSREPAGLQNPFALSSLNVHGDLREFQELCGPLNLHSHNFATAMISVIMRNESARQAHTVRLRYLIELSYPVGRINHHALAGVTVTNQVREVGHSHSKFIASCKVASG